MPPLGLTAIQNHVAAELVGESGVVRAEIAGRLH